MKKEQFVLSRKNIINIYKSLDDISKSNQIKNVQFIYAIIRNKKLLEDEVNSIDGIDLSKIEGYGEFERERVELCHKYSLKDENNNPTIQEGRYTIDPRKQDEFIKELRDLEEKYHDAVNERKRQEEELEKLLNEEIKISLYPITIEMIPDDVLTSQQLESVINIIKDDEENN
ncbi:MAG: hypothetical protein ACOCQD_00685 [archaeon]